MSRKPIGVGVVGVPTSSITSDEGVWVSPGVGSANWVPFTSRMIVGVPVKLGVEDGLGTSPSCWQPPAPTASNQPSSKRHDTLQPFATKQPRHHGFSAPVFAKHSPCHLHSPHLAGEQRRHDGTCRQLAFARLDDDQSVRANHREQSARNLRAGRPRHQLTV